MQDARKFFHHDQPFAMHRGGRLPEFTLAWESWGTLNEDRDNAVLILTGLSPDAHVASSADNPDAGWWEFMVGPGKPIDTNRWHVICVNSLGSCKGSTGPASANPETGHAYGLAFPELTIEDIARSAKLLLDWLDIRQLELLVGPSMGGMSALAFALQFPGSARNLISISSAANASPYAIAIRSLQREIIRQDRNWNDGDYHFGELPVAGMRLARKLGVISYRSAEEWRDRFKRDPIPPERLGTGPFRMEFEIESYLDAHADRFVGGFDPNCYIYLSRAMDWFDAADYGADADEALAGIRVARALVIGTETDALFPLYQQQQIRDGLERAGARVSFHALPSLQGHDAFLVDSERFGRAVRNFLKTL